jgi:hypothetical protein
VKKLAQLTVNIEDKLLNDFRRLAVNRRGKIHGVLKPEVELALRNHLAKQGERISSKEGVER